jgi:hypothetical protein
MIIWKPFHHNGVTYDLTHLHPYWCAFGQEAKGDKPARKYDVNVIFSLHCFSRKLKAGEVLDDALAYSDSRETRHFDFRRYELSKLLPEIVRALPTVE